mgnify:CR=1 FL=1|jgi:hypothetical protein
MGVAVIPATGLVGWKPISSKSPPKKKDGSGHWHSHKQVDNALASLPSVAIYGSKLPNGLQAERL